LFMNVIRFIKMNVSFGDDSPHINNNEDANVDQLNYKMNLFDLEDRDEINDKPHAINKNQIEDEPSAKIMLKYLTTR
jgi:hypothetical protein